MPTDNVTTLIAKRNEQLNRLDELVNQLLQQQGLLAETRQEMRAVRKLIALYNDALTVVARVP